MLLCSLIQFFSDYCIVLKEQVDHPSMPTAHNPPSVFEQVGPLVENWENDFNSIATNLEQQSKHEEPYQQNKEENLFRLVKTIYLSFVLSRL